MSRVEYVLIGTEEPFESVSARVAELLVGGLPAAAGERTVRLPGGGWAALDPEPFDPWTDERLQGYRWQLAVGGLVPPGVDVQEAAARRVYERLAEGTSWALALTYDHADALVAARSSRLPRKA